MHPSTATPFTVILHGVPATTPTKALRTIVPHQTTTTLVDAVHPCTGHLLLPRHGRLEVALHPARLVRLTWALLSQTKALPTRGVLDTDSTQLTLPSTYPLTRTLSPCRPARDTSFLQPLTIDRLRIPTPRFQMAMRPTNSVRPYIHPPSRQHSVISRRRLPRLPPPPAHPLRTTRVQH